MTGSGIQDARPAPAVLRALNPALAVLLRTPAGRLLDRFALLEFDGRRSGRRVVTPVGYHPFDRGWVVFTPAPWRENFAGGRAAHVRHRGRYSVAFGRLETDPVLVAGAFEGVLRAGASPRSLGLHVPAGTTVTPADVARLDRAMIRFEPPQAP